MSLFLYLVFQSSQTLLSPRRHCGLNYEDACSSGTSSRDLKKAEGEVELTCVSTQENSFLMMLSCSAHTVSGIHSKSPVFSFVRQMQQGC